jgi:hypothetical protein
VSRYRITLSQVQDPAGIGQPDRKRVPFSFTTSVPGRGSHCPVGTGQRRRASQRETQGNLAGPAEDDAGLASAGQHLDGAQGSRDADRLADEYQGAIDERAVEENQRRVGSPGLPRLCQLVRSMLTAV